MHENTVILYDNSNYDDPANQDDSAKHDSHDYHPKASEFTWKCIYSLMNENVTSTGTCRSCTALLTSQIL